MKQSHVPAVPLAKRAPRAAQFFKVLSLGVTLLCAAILPSEAQAQVQRLGQISPTEFSPSAVYVPAFTVRGGQLESNPAEIIQRDLLLSGFFRAPENEAFAKEAHALDERDSKINYPEWVRAKVAYVIKGNCEISGDQLLIEFRTYDMTAGTYIFGKRYEKYPIKNVRQLAHRISNDVIQRITGVPGFAHTQFVMVGEISGAKGGGQVKEVFVMDADGANVRRITNDNNLAATPTWGARGTEIYYTTYKDYNPDLAGIYLDGSYSWFVSRRAGFNLSPAWSEKNQLLALTLSKDGNSEVYTLNRSGKDLKRLTYTKSIDSSPVWSPNGDRIAFTSDRTGGPQIFIMDAAGLSPVQVTRKGSYNDGPAWSANGDIIAYSSRINGIFQICTIGANGENLRQLTNNSWNSEDPYWSPNGWVLAFTSDKGGTKQINTMFIDGRPIATLTSGGAHYSPNWSPNFP